MWLLNTTTLHLHEFHGQPPNYAILSHTWGKEEVSFQEIGISGCEEKEGYQKITRCCAQAKADGLDYAWVDTCCIDKKSSAELSEAINSMFRWYSEAHVCYAYLADVTHTPGRVQSTKHPYGILLVHSRWFTRGWTLQELLAPMDVVFYDNYWNEIGTKLSLLDEITEKTKIARQALTDPSSIREISVGEKLSWASCRNTTRKEDSAYCLMGIFDVNMPLLYGDGSKAFRRLQLQILAQSNDHSLLAWRGQFSKFAGLSATVRSTSTKYYRCNGILAATVADFGSVPRGLGKASHTMESISASSIMATNLGLSLSVSLLHRTKNLQIAVLDCQKGAYWIGLPVCPFGDGGDLYFRATPGAGEPALVYVHADTPLDPPRLIHLALDAPHVNHRSIKQSLEDPTTHVDFKSSASFEIVRMRCFQGHHLANRWISLLKCLDYPQPLSSLSYSLAGGQCLSLLLRNTRGTACSLLLGERDGRLWSFLLADEETDHSHEQIEPIWLEIQRCLADSELSDTCINDRAQYPLWNPACYLHVNIKKLPPMGKGLNIKNTSWRSPEVEDIS